MDEQMDFGREGSDLVGGSSQFWRYFKGRADRVPKAFVGVRGGADDKESRWKSGAAP